jgi:hypothetical protein
MPKYNLIYLFLSSLSNSNLFSPVLTLFKSPSKYPSLIDSLLLFSLLFQLFCSISPSGNPLIEEQKRVKSQLKHVQVPERPPLEIPKKKAIFRFSDEDELLEDEIQCVAPEVERRIEAGELIVQEESSRVVTQRSVRVEETGSVGKRITVCSVIFITKNITKNLG